MVLLRCRPRMLQRCCGCSSLLSATWGKKKLRLLAVADYTDSTSPGLPVKPCQYSSHLCRTRSLSSCPWQSRENEAPLTFWISHLYFSFLGLWHTGCSRTRSGHNQQSWGTAVLWQDAFLIRPSPQAGGKQAATGQDSTLELPPAFSSTV